MNLLNRSKRTMRTPSGSVEPGGVASDVDPRWVARQNTDMLRPVDDWCLDVKRAGEGWLIAECRRLEVSFDGETPQLRNRLLQLVDRGKSPQQKWASLWSDASEIAKEKDIEVPSRKEEDLKAFIATHTE